MTDEGTTLADEGIVARLAAEYGGDVQARTLWLQAGGTEEEIAYDVPPTERWMAMWNAALLDDDDLHMALAREMMLDRPGDEQLIGWVRAMAMESFEFLRRPVAFVVGLLEGAERGIEAEEGWAVLQLLPDDEGPQSFMLYAAALDGRLTEEQRAHVEEWLDAVARAECGDEPRSLPTLSGIAALLRRMLDFASPVGHSDSDRAAETADELLAGFRDEVESWAGEDRVLDAKRAGQVLARIEATVARLEEMEPSALGPVEQLSVLLEALGAPLATLEEGDHPSPVAGRARALKLAMWATCPSAPAGQTEWQEA